MPEPNTTNKAATLPLSPMEAFRASPATAPIPPIEDLVRELVDHEHEYPMHTHIVNPPPDKDIRWAGRADDEKHGHYLGHGQYTIRHLMVDHLTHGTKLGNPFYLDGETIRIRLHSPRFISKEQSDRQEALRRAAELRVLEYHPTNQKTKVEIRRGGQTRLRVNQAQQED